MRKILAKMVYWLLRRYITVETHKSFVRCSIFFDVEILGEKVAREEVLRQELMDTTVADTATATEHSFIMVKQYNRAVEQGYLGKEVKVLSNRYRGRGRPRASDYDYISMREYLYIAIFLSLLSFSFCNFLK